MNRKMTDRAFAGKWGALAASADGRPGAELLVLEQRGQRQAAEAAEGVADELAARAGGTAVREWASEGVSRHRGTRSG